MLFRHDFGIDLGSGMVKIYDSKTDLVVKERNMIAIRDEESILAVGNKAYDVFEKTPRNIKVVLPMQNGRINDVLMLEATLHTLLRRCNPHMGRHSVLYFTVPVDITEIERRAYYTIAHKGTLRKCRILLVEKPIADAISLGIPISRTGGSMIINIGAQSTELSVIVSNRVILSQLVPIGGRQFDQAISVAARRKNSLIISERTADYLKLHLTDLTVKNPDVRKAMGLDAITGMPRDGMMSSAMVTGAVLEQIDQLVQSIRRFMEHIPPQIMNSIRKEGIYLAGGSARIKDLDRFLSKRLGTDIRVSQDFDSCTILGLRELIQHKSLQHWATVPRNRKA